MTKMSRLLINEDSMSAGVSDETGCSDDALGYKNSKKIDADR